MFAHLCSLTLLALPLASASPFPQRRQSGWPAPEPCNGNCTFIHDPAVIRDPDDGTYYRFSTNGNIAIATADDLTGPWTYQGALLPEGSSITVSDGQEMWAPDVFFADGTYYVFYAVSKIGAQNSQIGIATSTGLAGPWTDQGAINVPQDGRWNLIDPNLFQQTGDAPYFFAFGSGWDAVFQTQLTVDSGFLDQAGDGPVQKAFNSTVPAGGSSPSITEGAYQFWTPDADGNPQFFLFFSSGACCNKAFNGGEGDFAAPGDEYKVMVCKSDAATGPFVDADGVDCATDNGGTLVLGSHDNIYAPGGQGVFHDDKADRDVLYYHYVDMDLEEGYLYENFRFGFNYLDFSSGWPVVVT